MKATGIVRRIDDLGRVVIPKEIRRNLRIREGEPLEIFVDREGAVILKKYSPIGELSVLAQEYAAAIYEVLEQPVFVSDRDNIVAAEGVAKRDYIGRAIGRLPEKAMAERRFLVRGSDEADSIFLDTAEDADQYRLAVPVVVQGDPVGAVMLCGPEEMGDAQIKVALSAAAVLARHMEN